MGQTLIYDHTGTRFRMACVDSIPLPGLNQTTSSGTFMNNQPIMASLDYDAAFEIVNGSGTSGLYMWDDSCKVQLGWPMTIFGEVDGTPWVGDVDNDGFFEMIVKGMEHRVHLFDLRAPYASSKVEWGQFAHDSHHTSWYEGVGAAFAPAGVAELAVSQNVPNPFNPTTSIQYSLDHAGDVTLAIYDVTGRLIRRLVNAWREPGAYAVEWDGRDEGGKRLASGVYIYRFHAGKFNATRKMLLLK